MDKETIQKMIDDAMAAAGEQFAASATSAASEAIDQKLGEIAKTVEDLSAKVKANDESIEATADALTPEGVQKIIADALAERDQAAAAEAEAQAARQAKADARAKFIADNAAKIPPAYHAHIPETGDEAELAAGLKAAQDALAADAKQFGFRLPDVGASAEGAGEDAPPSEADAEKSGFQDLQEAYAAGE